jgi:antitoxin VapB
MLITPVCHIEAIDRDRLNSLLVEWGHKMGPYNRPSYAIEAHHALMHHGTPVAVTAASDTVREVVGKTGIRRDQCVELARLCACRPHLCRAMLRLWREFIAPAVAAVHHRQIAISYQDADLHSGQTYRFDGWRVIGRGGGGGTDARTGRRSRDLRIWAYPLDGRTWDQMPGVRNA